jgi:hypothetical protein
MKRKLSPIATFFLTLMLLVLSTLPISCSQTNSSVSTPNTPTPSTPNPQPSVNQTPRGLFLNSANLPTQNWSKIEKFILNDPTVTGANVIVPWSMVDRGVNATPQYDWSYVYQQAQPWIEAGKTVNLLLWGVAQIAEQQFNNQPITPAYVLEQTETISCRCNAKGKCELNPPKTPVFWDEDYQKHYRNLVKAAVTEFSDKPWIGYFRFGIGVGAESYPGNGVSYADNPCTQKWEQPPINLSEAKWRDHSIDFLDFLSTLETSKTILVTINNYGKSFEIAREMAAYAADKGFGIGTQGLTQNAISLFQQNKPCYADWCNLFLKYDPQVPLEVQTAAQSNPAGKGRVGPLPSLLEFGLAKGVDIFELYQAEWFVANDPNHHLYQQYGASYRQALQKAAAALKE